jgi:pantothenate kinase
LRAPRWLDLRRKVSFGTPVAVDDGTSETEAKTGRYVTQLEQNARDLADRVMAAQAGNRLMVAIAGAPGSGKSTLADLVAEEINRRQPGLAAVFPMDGFHLDDGVLTDMGRLANKGAIDTFDAHGFRHMLERLKANDDSVVAVPVFDRHLEIARAGARLVPRETAIIICEGNYLLMRDEPWDRLKPIFDLTVLVDVAIEELRRRLEQRWFGFGLDAQTVRQKVDGNDLVNAVAIMERSAEPDMRIRN